MEFSNGYGLGFRGLEEKDISLLEKWYGMTDYFGYATGFKDFSSIKVRLMEPGTHKKVASMIFLEDREQAIGFVYGEIKAIETKIVFWIHILIIDPGFQHRGFGTCAVNKLLNGICLQYGQLTCIVAVSNKNTRGLSFWTKAGFFHSVYMEESLLQFGSSQVAILKRIVI